MNRDYTVTLVLPAVDGENQSTAKFTLHSPTIPAALGLLERKLPDSKHLTRSMNQATHNVDFPPYSNPSISLRYPQTPTNHILASLSHSQQTISNPTQTHTDTSLNGSFRDSDPTSASLQTKVLNHPTLPQSAETWQNVSRKRIRNMDEQQHLHAKKTTIGWVKPYQPQTDLAHLRRMPQKKLLQSKMTINPHRYSYWEWPI